MPTLDRRELLKAALLAGSAATLLPAAGTAQAQTAPADWAAGKRRTRVRNLDMAWYEAGTGDPIVFLHGNPTSSYLWRNIIPHVQHLGRWLETA